MADIDFTKTPAVAPPEGKTSNLENPHSIAPLVTIFTYVTTPPMVLALILRFYTRIFVSRKLGIDDWLSAIAGGCMIGTVAVLWPTLDNPNGRHIWDVPISAFFRSDFPWRSAVPAYVYFIAALSIKNSILLSYRRLFQISTTANIMIWLGIGLTTIFYTVFLIIYPIYCFPRASDKPKGGWWSLEFRDRCYKINAPIAISSGVFSSVIDIYILVIPLIPVTRLRHSLRKKIGICAIFVAGSMACVFSIIGLGFRVKFKPNDPNYDITYAPVPLWAMHLGEINMGIVSSTVPVAFIVFRRLTTKFRGQKSKESSSQSKPVDSDEGNQQLEMGRYPQVEGQGSNEVLTYASADYDYHHHLRVESNKNGRAYQG
ncbi:hypothetical protein QBC38DRAFT_425038 [Podospora fimiseda]|uniref:Rhodopsin domain-containing protein n=1 Tax=Podospora fimiseda TaxID=252190 RepID=A0AAN7BHU2_9PEZI|nr:hypothetical protein QBC38DRAFT_425038 [Podospora fimiseda]